jgi:hypothetical protein
MQLAKALQSSHVVMVWEIPHHRHPLEKEEYHVTETLMRMAKVSCFAAQKT